MAKELIERLQCIVPYSKIPDHLIKEINKKSSLITFRAGEYILRKGDICYGVFFLTQGLARSYYRVGNKEITSRLMAEGSIITSWVSFFNQEPATECIIAMEECHTFFLLYSDINKLYEEFPIFNTIGRKHVECSFWMSELRTQQLRGLTAEERYNEFLKSDSELIDRVPLKYIASYLGMTDVTLSRIRKKRKASYP